jgi:hypothetical protein
MWNIGGIGDAISGAVSSVTDELSAIKAKAEDAIQSGTNAMQAGLQTIPQVLPQMLPAAAAALASLNFRGSQGSFIDMGYPATFAAKFLWPVQEDRERLGRPLMQKRKLSSLAGFCLCKDPQIVIQGSIEEENAINTMLASGIYIE